MKITPTPEQRMIIEYPHLPVRIAAGAGTGKTTTLAMRIAHLVSSDGVEPERVLGLTFTNKAAQELSLRVSEMLGDIVDPGRDIEVHTYHGFAALLLSEFGIHVGVEHSSQVITPTFSRQLLFESAFTGRYQHLDVTWRGLIDRPERLSSALGDNLRTGRDLAAFAEQSEDELNQVRREYAEIICRFEDEKKRLGTLDYADLVRLSHEVVANNPQIAGKVRERYDIVLLDEYQDTNPAQRELLLAIFGDGFPVTAVGDPDQTIYEWRGASLENFAAFPQHFREPDGIDARTLSLTVNRRSADRIIAAANLVRARTGESDSADLVGKGREVGSVTTRWLRTAVDEANFIAERARELHDEGTKWREMAVLFRKNKDVSLVQQALEAASIPTEVATIGGLLAIPEVVDLHSWMRILNDPADTPALLRLLLGSRYKLGLGDIVPLSRWARSRNRAGDSTSLIEAIDQAVSEVGVSAREALSDFSTTYRRLLQDAQATSLVELARLILQQTHTWQEVDAMPDESGLSARLNLHRFLDVAEEWSPLEGRPSLGAFLAYLDLVAEGNTDELSPARLSGQDAVSLLTVHRAKGLEWEVVFIPAIYHGNFPSRVQSYEDPYVKPEVLPYELRLDRESLPTLTPSMDEDERREVLKASAVRQEWRTAYVALTRAKKHLYLSGAHWYGSPQPNKRAVEPSELYELVAEVSDDQRVDGADERPDLLRIPPAADQGPDPVFPSGWAEGLQAINTDRDWARRRASELGVEPAYHAGVEHLQERLFQIPEPPALDKPEPPAVSVTGLVGYATCPKQYFWTDVDRLPRRPSAAARRGVDVHRRIELHNRGEVPLDDLTVDNYDVGPGDAASEGTPAFQAFLSSRYATERPLLVEAPFELRIGAATVRGRIDAVYELDPGHWDVVDFKSGRRPSGGSAHVQLEAYAVAAAEVPFTAELPSQIDVTFAYLGGGLDIVSEHADPDWIARARSHLESLLAGISAGDYQPTPSRACHNCDFLKFCDEGRAWVESSTLH